MAAPAIEVVAAVEQLGHQVDVAGVALDEPVVGVLVVDLADRAVLGEVVEADRRGGRGRGSSSTT